MNDYNQADSYETAKEKLKRIMVNDIQSGILQKEILSEDMDFYPQQTKMEINAFRFQTIPKKY